MTNYDYYINEIMKNIGVDKKTGEVVNCPLNENLIVKIVFLVMLNVWKRMLKKYG